LSVSIVVRFVYNPFFMSIDWTQITEKYKGKWVALDKDEITVLSSSDTARGALEEARKKGHKEPILTRVPTEIVSYIS